MDINFDLITYIKVNCWR